MTLPLDIRFQEPQCNAKVAAMVSLGEGAISGEFGECPERSALSGLRGSVHIMNEHSIRGGELQDLLFPKVVRERGVEPLRLPTGS